MSWRIRALAAQAVSGVLLLAISLPLTLPFLADLSARSQIPDRLILSLFLLVCLWSGWLLLPDYFRRLIHRSLTRKSGFVGPGDAR